MGMDLFLGVVVGEDEFGVPIWEPAKVSPHCPWWPDLGDRFSGQDSGGVDEAELAVNSWAIIFLMRVAEVDLTHLFGKTGVESLPVLEELVQKLGVDQRTKSGQVGSLLELLADWAREHPEGVWRTTLEESPPRIRLWLARSFDGPTLERIRRLAEVAGAEVWQYPECGRCPTDAAKVADQAIYVSSGEDRLEIITHSELILLRLRRRIAETTLGRGRTAGGVFELTTDDLEVVWVNDDGTFEQVPVDRRGGCYVPKGMRGHFSQDLRDTAALARAQIEIGGKPAEYWGGVICTTHYQSWRTVALLKGLGFTHEREEDGDVFLSKNPIECVRESWGLDGLAGGYYISAFRFTGPGGHDDVVVFASSSTNSNQLFGIIGLGAYEDWKMMVEERPEIYGLAHWLRHHAISIA